MPDPETLPDALDADDLEFKELAGKTVLRACYRQESGQLGEPSNSLIEFEFSDGSLFRIDPRSQLRARFICDIERPNKQDVNYGILGSGK